MIHKQFAVIGRGKKRRGAMLVLVAITIVLLVIAAAFSVDVAYMQLTRTELRTSTDAAARAGIEALSRTQDVDAATLAAQDAASINLVAGEPLLLDPDAGDVIFGRSTRGANGIFDFNATDPDVNSVRVIGRRTADSPSGPVGLLFAGVLGPTTFLPTQVARAVHLDRDICVVLDRSGSMNWRIQDNTFPNGRDWCDGPDENDSRWAALARAMNLFLGLLDGTDDEELVGIASYSAAGTTCGVTVPNGRVDVRLTTDYTPILSRIAEYSGTIENGNLTDFRIAGGTNIAAGIEQGTTVVTDPARRRPFAEQTLIVLTDGVANSPGGEAAAQQAARDAATNAKANFPRLTIHTITFSDAANQTLMQEVAAIGGGSHFHAPTAERLEEIFEEIALTLPVVLTE